MNSKQAEKQDERIQAFRTALARERESSRDALAKERAAVITLRKQRETDTANHQAAIEQARNAQEELGNFRRVLAAAITNEKRSAGDAEAARNEVTRLQAELAQAIAARGVAEGRAQELTTVATEARDNLEQLQTEYRDRVDQLQTEYRDRVDQLRTEARDSAEQLRQEHDNALERAERRAGKSREELLRAMEMSRDEHRHHLELVEKQAIALRDELKSALASATEDHRRQLAQAEERASAVCDALRRELQQSEHERGVAFGRVKELLTKIPKELTASARAAAVRAQIFVGVATLLLALWLGMLPVLAISLFSAERAGHLSKATGLSTPGMVLFELALLVFALGLGSFGLRELRRSEDDKATASDADDTSAAESA